MAKHITSSGTMVSRVSVDKPYRRPMPTFSISESDLPAIKNWSVGKKYSLTVDVEMVSHSKGEYAMEGEAKKHEARLKITSIKEAK